MQLTKSVLTCRPSITNRCGCLWSFPLSFKIPVNFLMIQMVGERCGMRVIHFTHCAHRSTHLWSNIYLALCRNHAHHCYRHLLTVKIQTIRCVKPNPLMMMTMTMTMTTTTMMMMMIRMVHCSPIPSNWNNFSELSPTSHMQSIPFVRSFVRSFLLLFLLSHSTSNWYLSDNHLVIYVHHFPRNGHLNLTLILLPSRLMTMMMITSIFLFHSNTDS